MRYVVPILFFLASAPNVLLGQSTVQSNDGGPISSINSSAVPGEIRFSGVLRAIDGTTTFGTHNVTFGIYRDETGGVPMWTESRSVVVDSQGRFTVLLGSASAAGVPSDVFVSDEPRWIGIIPDDGVERPRIPIATVPYAFKSADSDRLGGRGVEEFVSQEELNSLLNPAHPDLSYPVKGPVPWPWPPPVPIPVMSGQAPRFEATFATGPSFVSDAVTGPPMQVMSNTLVQNLNVDQLHGFSDSDFAKLNSTNTFTLGQRFNGGISFPPVQNNASGPEPSSPQDFQVIGSSSAGLIDQTFRWQANGADQGSQPTLGLSFGSDGQTPQSTGFSLNSDGTLNFAAGQTFPGSAIMTAITPLLQSDGVLGSNGQAPGQAPDGSSGGISQTPSGSQTITQSSGTTLNVNNLNNIRTVETSDNWLKSSIASTLIAGQQATVTLTPCPVGIDTSGNPILGGPFGGYAVYVADGLAPNQNSESVYVTGGTCTSGAATGTIIFTPYFSHAASTYSVGSASGGIQEAINDACGTNPLTGYDGDCHITIPPSGPQTNIHSDYDIYETIYFHANNSLLSGYGAVLKCHERGPCLQLGNLTYAGNFSNNRIEGISFLTPDNRQSDPAFHGSLIQSTQRIGGTITIQTAKPHNLRSGDRVTQLLTDTSAYWGDVPAITVSDPTHYTYTRANTSDIPFQTTPGVTALSYEAILDNAENSSFVGILDSYTESGGAFNIFFDFWDDENALIDQFNNNAVNLNENANWVPSFVWSGGALNLPIKSHQLAPVITVQNSTVTANGSNCATIYNSNGFYFQNSVCQAQGAWEFLISNINGNYQGAAFLNIYSEASYSTNPGPPSQPWSPWPGMGSAGLIGGDTSGKYTLSGAGSFQGVLPTVGTGPTTFVYYVVARDVTAGTETSPLPFMYERESSSNQLTVQWPRLSAGTDTILYDVLRASVPFGTINAAAGNYVAPYAGGCNGGSTSACGSIATMLPQCSGLACSIPDNTATPTSSYKVMTGNFVPNPTFWPGTAVLSDSPLQSDQEIEVTGIGFQGAPTQYANDCTDEGSNVSGGYTVCFGSPTVLNGAVSNQAPLILTDGPTNGTGGLPGAKGRLIFESTATGRLNYHQVITLFDSNPNKTQATTGHRPVGDPGDVYLGIDPNLNLMIGGGATGISQYINNIGDGVSWGEQLTSSLKTFKVPVQLSQLLTGSADNTDVEGTISISGSNSGTFSFLGKYTTPPNCVVTPMSDPSATGVYWVTISTATLTVNVKTAGTISFGYHCWGRTSQ